MESWVEPLMERPIGKYNRIFLERRIRNGITDEDRSYASYSEGY